MIYIVDNITGEILNECDAWEEDSVRKMKVWCRDCQYRILKQEVTFSGNMILWVEFK